MLNWDNFILQKKDRALALLVALVLAALSLLAAILPTLYSLFLLGALLVVAVLTLKPGWFLIVLLVVRSSTDIFQDQVTFFPGAWYSANLAGLLNILAVGVGFFFLARRFARGQRWLPSAPLFLLGSYLLVSALSIPGSLDFGASLKAWARLAGYLGIALLALEVARSEQDSRTLYRYMLVAALPPLLLGMYQAATKSGYFFSGYTNTLFAFRPQGTFGHPAILASFLLILIALVLCAYIYSYPLAGRLTMAGLLAAYLALTVLTFARTEWIGLAGALGVIGILRYRRLLVIGLLAGSLLLALPLVQARLHGEQASESFEWRLSLWDASLTLLQRPTWTGSGLDTSPALINKVLLNVESPPHNDYLRAAIETGILGFIIYLLLQVALLRQGWRAWRDLPGKEGKMLGLAVLASTCGGLVISFSDNYFSYVPVQWVFWALVGFLIARSQLEAGPAAPEMECAS